MTRTNDENKPLAIVTGANGVIGKAIAAGIAKAGFAVVMVCRDEKRAARAMDEVRRASGSSDVRVELADLSRRESVFALAARWQGRLDVLVNNAAIAPRRRTETPEGIELQFATNVLGYLWMMRAFEATLRKSAPARVVNVASYWAGDLDLSDLQFQRRRYDNDQAYRQSKQANRMLTVALAQRWRDADITVNSCHPGDANSALSNALGFGGNQTPEQAASTPVWLATDPSLADTTGQYFANCRPARCVFAADAQGIAALDAICAKY
jgi:NAD(P)-dependent dehydrogenase (short-subunit alcohol dehydrogenase family)